MVIVNSENMGKLYNENGQTEELNDIINLREVSPWKKVQQRIQNQSMRTCYQRQHSGVSGGREIWNTPLMLYRWISEYHEFGDDALL